MTIHILQHAEWETIGLLDKWFSNKGLSYSTTMLYKGESLPKTKVDLLVVMGGPMGIFDDENHPWLREERKFIKQTINSGSKVLGICLGSQFIAKALGAKVYPGKEKEIGFFGLQNKNNHPITKKLPDFFEVFHWHGDTFETPKSAVNLFSSELTENQGFIYDNRVIALQFHLEVGKKEINGFVENGIDELTPSTYVQHKNEILNRNFDFDKSNSYLFDILDFLYQQK
jgi:GMP synthase (glutamine-hydrolysing)